MLDRSFIEKIESMSKVEIVVGDDKIERSTKQLHVVRKPMADSLNTNSLDGLVKFVKNTLNQPLLNYPLMINVSHNGVAVHSQLSDGLDRDTLIKANPLLPELRLGNWQSVEDFIIKLQTGFIETDNRNKLQELVSNFMNIDSVELIDNGFGQEVTITAGVALNEKVEIQPIVQLQPIRTFTEVAQPTSIFLFRINKQGNVCLFEADGGVWKDEARRTIVSYLENQLGDLIGSNEVVVIG